MALKSVYSTRNYYKRIKTFLAEYRPCAKLQPMPVTWMAWTLNSVFWRLGVVGRERWYFWKLCVWTFLRRPRLLPEAITLSIFDFHYRKVLIDSLKAG
jgi:hypothetical protein